MTVNVTSFGFDSRRNDDKSLLRYGVEAKRGVEFHYSTRIAVLTAKLGAECLNTRLRLPTLRYTA